MLKVGLTGGIGSGKSTVAKIFEMLGIPVFDADSSAKILMETNSQLVSTIKENFGETAYISNKLNRKYIAEIVFKDEFKLDLLNSIVHPIAIEAGLSWAALQKAPYVLKEAALMFEAGSAFNLDYVIGVFAPSQLRIQRVMQRENYTREEVLKRMNNQIEDSIKMKLCDFVLKNDEQSLLLPQVIQLHERLLKLAEEKK